MDGKRQTVEYFDKKAVGTRIRDLRKMRDMTQEEFAEMLGYSSERQLQRIESGYTACSVDKLMEIAQVIGTSTDYLLFGKRSSDGLWDEIFHILCDKSKEQNEYIYRLIKVAVENFSILAGGK